MGGSQCQRSEIGGRRPEVGGAQPGELGTSQVRSSRVESSRVERRSVEQSSERGAEAGKDGQRRLRARTRASRRREHGWSSVCRESERVCRGFACLGDDARAAAGGWRRAGCGSAPAEGLKANGRALGLRAPTEHTPSSGEREAVGSVTSVRESGRAAAAASVRGLRRVHRRRACRGRLSSWSKARTHFMPAGSAVGGGEALRQPARRFTHMHIHFLLHASAKRRGTESLLFFCPCALRLSLARLVLWVHTPARGRLLRRWWHRALARCPLRRHGGRETALVASLPRPLRATLSASRRCSLRLLSAVASLRPRARSPCLSLSLSSSALLPPSLPLPRSSLPC